MSYTLIIDSSNLPTDEFKRSRSVCTAPVISGVFLYLDSFLCVSFAQLWSGYAFIQSFLHSINIYLTYNPHTGPGLRDRPVFTDQQPRQHETIASLKKRTLGVGYREMTITSTQRTAWPLAEERYALEMSVRAIIFWLSALTLNFSNVLLFLMLFHIFVLELPFPRTRMLCL